MSDIRFNQWLHQSGTGGVSQVASGAVGVGTTNPLADFYVRGDAQITGILTAGHIAMGSSITFGDDDRAYFGDGTDLQIYHSGSHSFIQDTGTGNLFIDSNSVQIRNAVASKTTAKFFENAQVELYYNNTERIRTTNTGAVVTGILTATTSLVTTGNFVANGSMTVGSYAVFGAVVGADPGSNYYGTTNRFGGGVSISGALNIDGDIGHIGDTNTKIRFPINDTISFETAGSERLRIDSSGRVLIGGTSAIIGSSSEFNEIVLTGKTRGAGITLQDVDANVRFQIRTDDDSSGTLGTLLNASTNHDIFFRTNNTERLRITSDGYVGVKRSTPLANLHTTNNELAIGANPTSAAAPNATYDGLVVDGEEISIINIRSRATGNTSSGKVIFSDDVRGRGYIDYRHRDGAGGVLEYMSFATAGLERLRITSSGTVLKGLTTPRQNYSNNTSGVEYGFQIEATSATKSSLSLIRSSNDANDGGIFIGKTRSTSVGGNTAVQAGDDLGTITFGGADGTSLLFGAEILAEAQSGVGNDDMPTDIIFKTNGGSTNTAERLRISSAGYVTKPATPAFFATHTGNNASGSTGYITYNTGGPYYNNGSHFNVNGRFTAPVTGIYHFHFHCFVHNTATQGNVEIILRRFNSDGGGETFLTRGFDNKVNGNYGPAVSMAWTGPLTASQYVQVYSYDELHHANGYFFGGYLVG